MLIELPASLPRPAFAALYPHHDPLGIELEATACGRWPAQAASNVAACIIHCLVAPRSGSEAEELGPPLRVRSCRELIPALLPIKLILGHIGSLASSRTSRAISSKSRVDSRLALPAIRVPSIATTPGLHQPRLRAQPQHLAEQLRQRSSCRATNRAIVA